MKWFISFALSLNLIVPVSALGSDKVQQAPTRERDHTAEVIEFLQSAGLTVKKVAGSHLGGTFKDEHDAVFIETDKGKVEAIIFTKGTDPFQLRITFYMAKDERSAVHYHYRFEGLAAPDEAGIDSAYPTYFTMRKNWIFITNNCELDNIIKAKLHSGRR
jgi:hypothetical protein